ncbi:hypothetical protein [Flagellimonas sp. S3867]|uniref:hypothetical protein n=1 Tax=Flagellimonas sp. S3867 TaxID=2768063 RepID=UPI0016836391|nr:hypothetical protein [Flagellimonas sp. S3867]
MSESIFNQFLSLLLSGNINKLATRYYDDSVKVTLNEGVKTRGKSLGIQWLQHILKNTQILQFNVEKIRRTENSLSYEIYMITRNQDSTLDFSKHRIQNTWKDNRICQHQHAIVNF